MYWRAGFKFVDARQRLRDHRFSRFASLRKLRFVRLLHLGAFKRLHRFLFGSGALPGCLGSFGLGLGTGFGGAFRVLFYFGAFLGQRRSIAFRLGALTCDTFSFLFFGKTLLGSFQRAGFRSLALFGGGEQTCFGFGSRLRLDACSFLGLYAPGGRLRLALFRSRAVLRGFARLGLGRGLLREYI